LFSIVESGNILFCIKPLNKEDKWILDSGATEHVTMNIQNFTTYQEVKNIKVNLPNDNCVVATHKGDVKIHDDIIMHNVLFIPDFHFNLISISRLITDSHVHIVFTNSECFI